MATRPDQEPFCRGICAACEKGVLCAQKQNQPCEFDRQVHQVTVSQISPIIAIEETRRMKIEKPLGEGHFQLLDNAKNKDVD